MKTKNYILFLLVCFVVNLYSQHTQTVSEVPIADNVVGASPEEMPEFPGGTKALMDFIRTNLKIPDTITEKYINRKVYLKFIVDTTGTAKDAEVLKGIKDCPECDEEAKRLISIMPKWKPGKVNGKLAPVRFNIPINIHPK